MKEPLGELVSQEVVTEAVYETLTIAEYEERYVRPAVARWAEDYERQHPEEVRRARRNLRRRLRRKGLL